MEPKKKRGRPPGSGKKTKEESAQPFPRTKQQDVALTEAINNHISEMTTLIKVKDREYPPDWATMGKLERLKFLTANKK